MNAPAVDFSVLPAFLPIVVALCLAPGPDMAYMVATGVAGGRSAAIRASLGVTLGVFVYAVAVAAGLGVVVARHAEVVTVLQIFGAAYLFWLARDTILDTWHVGTPPPEGQRGDPRWFRRGLLVNLTNPKVLLFFVAFLPQFLGAAGSATAQLLMLGFVFQAIGLVVDLAIGWTAGSVRDRVLARPGTLRTMSLTSAGVYVTLATVVTVEVALRIV